MGKNLLDLPDDVLMIILGNVPLKTNLSVSRMMRYFSRTPTVKTNRYITTYGPAAYYFYLQDENPDESAVNNVRVLYNYALDNDFDMNRLRGMVSKRSRCNYRIDDLFIDCVMTYPVHLESVTVNDFVNNPSATLLITAVLNNDVNTVYKLLSFLPVQFINYCDVYGNTLFMLAVLLGYYQMVKMLLELSNTLNVPHSPLISHTPHNQRIDVNRLGVIGMTASYFAALAGYRVFRCKSIQK
jgi:ankyrin repeat protein